VGVPVGVRVGPVVEVGDGGTVGVLVAGGTSVGVCVDVGGVVVPVGVSVGTAVGVGVAGVGVTGTSGAVKSITS
jgi:hypothetical protein